MESEISENISFTDVHLENLPQKVAEIYDFGKIIKFGCLKLKWVGEKLLLLAIYVII